MWASGYMRFRTGKVITLGELFLLLGREQTAASIYSFFRTLRVVVVKRRKSESYAPGSASARLGLTASSLQANNMKRGLCLNIQTKEYLVAEFLEAVGLPNQPKSRHLLGVAVRHMHKMLLCDLNTPLGRPPIPPGSARGRCAVSFHAPELSTMDRRSTGDGTCFVRK